MAAILKMTYTLIKADGTSHSWTAQDLSAILARMIAAEQAVCVGAEGVAMMNARDGLLLVDAEWVIGRRLTELFTAEARSGQPYGVGFLANSTVFSVHAALEACGYSGVPVSSLAAVHMVFYDAGSSKYAEDASAAGVKLVKSGGVLGGDSAKIRTLVAGTGVTLDGGTDSVTISAPSDSRLGLLDDFSWNSQTQLLEYSRGGIQALNRLRAAGGGIALVDVQGGDNSVRLACRADKVELVAQSQCPLVLQTFNGTAQVDALRLEASGAAAVQSLTVGGEQAVTTNDARLSDARTPSANSVTNASVADGALSAAKISGLSDSLSDKAPLLNPVFLGEPRGTKAPGGDNSTWLATTSFVVSTVAAVIGAAPETLNTLDELAAALGDDANFASTVATAIGMKADAAATTAALALKAPLESPTFTGTVGGITKAMVGLGSVDNTSDASKPVSAAQQTALNLKANLSGATFTGTVTSTTTLAVTDANIIQMGQGVAGRHSDAGRIAYGKFTAGALDIVGGGTAIGNRLIKLYDNVDVTGSLTVGAEAVVLTNDARLSDSRPPAAGSIVDASVSATANIAQSKIASLVSDLASKAPLASPSFTGTVSGITKAMVGLGSVDNTSDASKPISTAQQTALNLKANLAGADFTGGVSVSGSNVIQMGQGVTREANAGKIGYNTFGFNALDIVGAGTVANSRIVKLYDDVIVNGGLSSTNAISVGGQAVVLTNDSRLSDARPPTAGSVVDASVSSSAAIAQSKISGLVSALASKLGASGSQLLSMDGYSVGAVYSYPTIRLTMDGTEQARMTTDASNSVKFQRLVLGSYADSLAISAGGDLTVSGALLNPGRSYVFAQVTNTQSVGAGVTYGILWNSFTTVGNAISYNSTNGRFTVSVAGLYTVEAVCRLANYSSTIRSVMQIQKNGGPAVWEADSTIGINIVATLLLAANDYIQIAVYNGGASSTTLNTGSVSSATMRLVG